jgi:uncharacterized protein YdeI (YjbR/CyaY-like superfamily)
LASKEKEDLEPAQDLMVGDQKAWETWLATNHAESSGVWLVLAKKGSGLSTPTYQEALEVALCFGWIDGQKSPRDERVWVQRFTPRRPKSIWSRINVEKAEALIAAGKMRPAGLAAIEKAKEDGRWAQAYAGQKTATVPDDLKRALEENGEARAFFATLNSANRYAILFRIETAKKPETRARRIEQFVVMLAAGEKLHP